MAEILRWLSSRLIGWRWVILNHHDGEQSIRRIRWFAGQPIAYVYGRGSIVYLHDHGKTTGRSFIADWAPYEPRPFAPKRWPIPNSPSGE
jgi:hypothetical protein